MAITTREHTRYSVDALRGDVFGGVTAAVIALPGIGPDKRFSTRRAAIEHAAKLLKD